jgi:hypothetical protein
MQEFPSSRVWALPLVRPGIDVVLWVHCSMSSAPNALMAAEFVHLMQDSLTARRDGQHRFEASSRFVWKDERIREAMVDG